jgi:hypothetical protein
MTLNYALVLIRNACNLFTILNFFSSTFSLVSSVDESLSKMALIPVFVLAISFISLTSSSLIAPETKKLSEWYDKLDELVKSDLYGMQDLNSANRSCVKERIRYQNNKNRLFDNRNFIYVLVKSAFEMCVESQDELWRTRVSKALERATMESGETIDCLKNEIEQIEPTATILGDFNGEDFRYREEDSNCHIAHSEPYLDYYMEFHSENDCFERTGKTVKYSNLIHKLKIIKSGVLNTNERGFELKQLRELMKRMVMMNFNCLVKQIG